MNQSFDGSIFMQKGTIGNDYISWVQAVSRGELLQTASLVRRSFLYAVLDKTPT